MKKTRIPKSLRCRNCRYFLNGLDAGCEIFEQRYTPIMADSPHHGIIIVDPDNFGCIHFDPKEEE